MTRDPIRGIAASFAAAVLRDVFPLPASLQAFSSRRMHWVGFTIILYHVAKRILHSSRHLLLIHLGIMYLLCSWDHDINRCQNTQRIS